MFQNCKVLALHAINGKIPKGSPRMTAWETMHNYILQISHVRTNKTERLILDISPWPSQPRIRRSPNCTAPSFLPPPPPPHPISLIKRLKSPRKTPSGGRGGGGGRMENAVESLHGTSVCSIRIRRRRAQPRKELYKTLSHPVQVQQMPSKTMYTPVALVLS